MFIVAENVVSVARIDIWQIRAAPANLKELGREAAFGPLPADPLEAFLGSSAHRHLTDSPAAAASSRTNFSVAGSLMFSGMGRPGRINLYRKIIPRPICRPPEPVPVMSRLRFSSDNLDR